MIHKFHTWRARSFATGLCVCSAALFADSKEGPDVLEQSPWFTGPIVAQSSTVVPLGHIDFETYFLATDNYAVYNNHWKSNNVPDFWALNTPLFLWFGIAPWADIVVQPNFVWNRTEHAADWVLADSIVGLEIQLLDGVSGKGRWRPSIKFSLWQTFPTGKYRNSNPKKHLTDLGGQGAYTSRYWIAIGNTEHIYDKHYLRWEVNLSYSISSRVHVEGINAYGGGEGTDGKVRPGSVAFFDLGLEYNLTRNWALACDFSASWQGSAHFRGEAGTLPNGDKASNSPPANIFFSTAPAIEYNFSENLGLIAGVWLSVAGKNTDQFCIGTIALNYYR